MSPLAVLLVLVSAATHAYWNFLMKRAGGSHAFVGISKASEALVFFVPFLFVVATLPDGTVRQALPYIAGGTLSVLLAYGTLAVAYRYGELSFTYPIARGGALLFLPALGWLVLAERVGTFGWIAIASILTGVVIMQLPELTRAAARDFFVHARGPATLLALLMAFFLAAGTIWDKISVVHSHWFVYFYGYTAAAGVCYLSWATHRYGRAAIGAEWRAHGGAAVAVGVLNTLSYGLALVALRTGGSTYVVGLRQISIAIGVFLGARLLGERLSMPRRIGVSFVIAGALLMAIGR